MQRSEHNEIQENRVSGVLEPGPVFVHNRHLQSGNRKSAACGICEEGLAGAVEAVEERRPEAPKVAESDGADEEEDPASPPGSWASAFKGG